MHSDKKVLLIGGSGTLGSAIIKSKLFSKLDHPSRKKLNLHEKSSINNIFITV